MSLASGNVNRGLVASSLEPPSHRPYSSTADTAWRLPRARLTQGRGKGTQPQGAVTRTHSLFLGPTPLPPLASILRVGASGSILLVDPPTLSSFPTCPHFQAPPTPAPASPRRQALVLQSVLSWEGCDDFQAGVSEMGWHPLHHRIPHLPAVPRGPLMFRGKAEAQERRDLGPRVTHGGRLSTEQEEHWR